jgi:hypothetical protein
MSMSDELLNCNAPFEIVGYTPPAESVVGGGFGFEIKLSLSFAQKCLETLIDGVAQQRLERRCRENVVQRMFGLERTRHYPQPTARWVESSLMLASMEVPGTNGCWVALEPEQMAILRGRRTPLRRDALSFTTHNVDTHTQAFALLSCWLHWHRAAASALQGYQGAGTL